jgi:hypothetical protein
VSPSAHEAILRVTRTPVDAAWLEAELNTLERLVEDGETLELVGALGRIVRDPRRAAPTDAAATALAEPVTETV